VNNETASVQEVFQENGYVIVRNAIGQGPVQAVLARAETLLGETCDLHRRRFPRQGSMLPTQLTDPVWASLITYPSIIRVMNSLGAQDLRWLSGYVISKPPHSPRLWWHQDWWAWQHPITCALMPAQLSVMIYPAGATEHNGCLRIIPRSHRTRHRLHDVLPEAHSPEVNNIHSNHMAYAIQSDEISIPVRPGDIVLCDVRLLHATFANSSDNERPCITLWYVPSYRNLPEEFKQHYAQHPCQPRAADLEILPPHLRKLAIPAAEGDELVSVDLNRTPGELLPWS